MIKKKAGQPLSYKTVEELQTAVDHYFAVDAFIPQAEGAAEYLPTMSGLALSLGVDRKTVLNYSNKEEYFPTIRKAKSKIESFIETRLYGNNVTGCIFNLKNNFDWKDKTEVNQTNVEMSHEDWLNSLE
jgi:hypothetical protein|tara:strand:- start:196 stop:582 length:387 start_codon:yes stop_codon:yes gene_type:complete